MRTIQRIWFNGREFQRVTWHDNRVTVVWAVTEHINVSVMRGTFMGRREI